MDGGWMIENKRTCYKRLDLDWVSWTHGKLSCEWSILIDWSRYPDRLKLLKAIRCWESFSRLSQLLKFLFFCFFNINKWRRGEVTRAHLLQLFMTLLHWSGNILNIIVNPVDNGSLLRKINPLIKIMLPETLYSFRMASNTWSITGTDRSFMIWPNSFTDSTT